MTIDNRLPRRKILGAALALTVAAPLTSLHAQTSWPNKPIRVVVGFAPGGGVDLMARTLGIPLADVLGQPLVVDNKPGAVGSIAAADVIRQPPDGYNILFGATFTQTVNPSVMKGSPNVARDLMPVAIIGRYKYHLVVRGDLPVNSIQELVALAKSQPGKLNYASAGPGSQPHLLGELFQQQAGINIVQIPYKGSGPAMQAVLAKEADMVFDPGIANQHVDAGKMKMLATTSDKRPPRYPNVPVFAEVGIQGMEADAWIGVWVPTGTPPAIVDRLNKALATVLADTAIKKRFDDMTAEAIHMDTAKFRQILATEEKMMTSLIRDRNIKIE
ncbi:tripartite tricarboxylate transporter substrate binding protein [Polaromonas sp. P1-6]|nr:tripartite tricarboxylate transporter substrate binding protein [Polaromonas sp. P1-6]